MKTMTCTQLGGACEMEFKADSFEAIAEMSKNHGMEMYQKGDEAHLEAMSKMQAQMQSPDAMGKWMEEKRAAFNAMPDL